VKMRQDISEMIGKIRLRSYKSVSSKLVRRRCPKCKKNAETERVDYGAGGVLLFCECGDVREVRKTGKQP
jgi:hypothetical protein